MKLICFLFIAGAVQSVQGKRIVNVNRLNLTEQDPKPAAPAPAPAAGPSIKPPSLESIKFAYEVIKDNRPVVETTQHETDTMKAVGMKASDVQGARTARKKFKWVLVSKLLTLATVSAEFQWTYGAKNWGGRGPYITSASISNPAVHATFGNNVNVDMEVTSDGVMTNHGMMVKMQVTAKCSNWVNSNQNFIVLTVYGDGQYEVSGAAWAVDAPHFHAGDSNLAPETGGPVAAGLRKKLADQGMSLKDLSSDDIQKMQAAGMLDPEQAILANVLSKKDKEDSKPKELLPYPDLPEGTIPEPSDLSSMSDQKMPELKTVYADDDGPVDIAAMTPSTWLQVFKNCDLPRGIIMDHFDRPAHDQLLLPTNTARWQAAFHIAQTGSEMTSNVDFSSNFRKLTELSSFEAFAKVQTPYVSASYKYSSENEHQHVSKGQTATIVRKFLSPVGTFTLYPDVQIQVEADGNGYIAVNPAFVKAVANALDEAEMADTSNKAEKFLELMKPVTERFGDIYPALVTIGVAAVTHDFKQIQSDQDLEKLKKMQKGAINVGFSGFGGGAGASGGNQKTDEHGSQQGTQSRQWKAIAGNSGNTVDPSSIAKFRTNPASWRAIQYKEFRPVIDLLPSNIRDRVKKIGEQIPKPTTTTTTTTTTGQRCPSVARDTGTKLIGARQNPGQTFPYVTWNFETVKVSQGDRIEWWVITHFTKDSHDIRWAVWNKMNEFLQDWKKSHDGAHQTYTAKYDDDKLVFAFDNSYSNHVRKMVQVRYTIHPSPTACEVVMIGSSGSNEKCVSYGGAAKCRGDSGNPGKRANVDNFGDTFDVTQNGQRICVRRTGSSGGWGMNLQLKCEPGIGVVYIGASGSNKKCVTPSSPVVCAPDAGNLGKRWNQDNFGDTFQITAEGGNICARRTGSSGGWGMDLQLRCTPKASR